jgi:hypothetical protein
MLNNYDLNHIQLNLIGEDRQDKPDDKVYALSLEAKLINNDLTLYDYDNNTEIQPKYWMHSGSNENGTSFTRTRGHGVIYNLPTSDVKSISYEYYADPIKKGDLKNDWGGLVQYLNRDYSPSTDCNLLVSNKYPSDGFQVQARPDSASKPSIDLITVNSTTNAERGKWHKVCITTNIDPSKFNTSETFYYKVYVDGVYIGGNQGFYRNMGNNGTDLIIGNSWRLEYNGEHSTDVNPFCGTIRNVRLFRTELSSRQARIESKTV